MSDDEYRMDDNDSGDDDHGDLDTISVLRREAKKRRTLQISDRATADYKVYQVPAAIPLPGDPDCNQRLQDALEASDAVDNRFDCGGQLQYHQSVLKWMTTPPPDGPGRIFDRMLVAWSPGTGKTRGMIEVLNNYWSDPRPKTLWLPNTALVHNFMSELVKWPSRYRDALRHVGLDRPETFDDKDQVVSALQGIGPGGLFVRTFAQGGEKGHHSAFSTVKMQRARTWVDRRGRQIKPRVGGQSAKGDACPLESSFDGFVLLVDEAHLFIEPNAAMANAYAASGNRGSSKDNIECMRRRLQDARGSSLFLFTGTPAVRPGRFMDDVRTLACMAAGIEPDPYADTDDRLQGRISFFMHRPSSVFRPLDPRIVPKDAQIVKVPMNEKFMAEYNRFLKSLDVPADEPVANCVDNYFEAHCQKGYAARAALAFNYKDAKEADNVKHLKLSMQDYKARAPKLAAILEDLLRDKEMEQRIVISMYADSGAAYLNAMLQKESRHRSTPGSGRDFNFTIYYTGHKDKHTNAEVLKDFNKPDLSAARRKAILIHVADQLNEGVSILNVDRLILADLSPGTEKPTMTSLEQRLSRVLRWCDGRQGPSITGTVSPKPIDLKLYVLESADKQPPLPDLELGQRHYYYYAGPQSERDGKATAKYRILDTNDEVKLLYLEEEEQEGELREALAWLERHSFDAPLYKDESRINVQLMKDSDEMY